MGIKTALPAAELGLYSLVVSGALAYAGRGLLEASQGNRGLLRQEPGNPQSSDQQTRNLEAVDPEESLGPGFEHKSTHI